MERLYREYKDVAAIYIVYISEAHAIDGPRPRARAQELGIREHASFSDRCAVAKRLVGDNKLTIACLVDSMDAVAEKAYRAWPDRVYLIARDGTLAVAGNRGPRGLKPALEAVEKWLTQYKKTGTDPGPVEVPRGPKPAGR